MLLAISLAIRGVAGDIAGDRMGRWQFCWRHKESLVTLLAIRRVAGDIAGNERCRWRHKELLAMLLAIQGVAGNITGDTEHD